MRPSYSRAGNSISTSPVILQITLLARAWFSLQPPRDKSPQDLANLHANLTLLGSLKDFQLIPAGPGEFQNDSSSCPLT
jgi:hypothetical protein